MAKLENECAASTEKPAGSQYLTAQSELGRGLRFADAVAALPRHPDDALVGATVLLLDVVDEQARLRHHRLPVRLTRRCRRGKLGHANPRHFQDRPAVFQPREVKFGNCTEEEMFESDSFYLHDNHSSYRNNCALRRPS